MTVEPVHSVERNHFVALFSEFADTFLLSDKGKEHLDLYEQGRAHAQLNFDEISRMVESGEDVTHRVSLHLLPYTDTAPNRAKGAWIHVAPAIQSDAQKLFEKARWTPPGEWPTAMSSLFDFVRSCIEHPNDLGAQCEHFTDLPHTKGLQSGMVSPILNALRPDIFLLLNSKSARTISYFSGQKVNTDLCSYPEANEIGWELVRDITPHIKNHVNHGVQPADLFDMFAHWLVALKRHDFGSTSYWKVSPGEGAKYWDEWREEGYVAIGWSDLGDLSGLHRPEFEKRRDEALAIHHDWRKAGVEQVWKFAHITEGDRIVINHGTKKVLGIGTVTGPYFYTPEGDYAHRLPVTWDDTEVRAVDEPSWVRALIRMDRGGFEKIVGSPSFDAPYFTDRTFELLVGLHEQPHSDYYAARKAEFAQYLEEPFRQLFARLRLELPRQARDAMETEKNVIARILKNDYGKHGAWDFYWGAFYPKDQTRITGVQLFVLIKATQLEYGFYVAESDKNGHDDSRAMFKRRCRENRTKINDVLGPKLEGAGITYGHGETDVNSPSHLTLGDWLLEPENGDWGARVIVPRDQVLQMRSRELVESVSRTFELLFHFVLIATTEAPVDDILSGLVIEVAERNTNDPYDLDQLTSDTALDRSLLEGWIAAIERKKQAIIYGPPGTGKTFVAEKLARHICAGGNGFTELVQFHPSYSYEDFMEGIRPETSPEGALRYSNKLGHFQRFCERARGASGNCVLIVDEINRANLSRVFGELMYLLEYRGKEVLLPSGRRFSMPQNVRLIGTMNTADRSIALVDYALRRRFAFLSLAPMFGILRQYHENTGFPVDKLVGVLEELNDAIKDPHYAIGISFFLHEELALHFPSIWQMEIEPYLEEYFFDRKQDLERFRLHAVMERVGL